MDSSQRKHEIKFTRDEMHSEKKVSLNFLLCTLGLTFELDEDTFYVRAQLNKVASNLESGTPGDFPPRLRHKITCQQNEFEEHTFSLSPDPEFMRLETELAYFEVSPLLNVFVFEIEEL